MPTERHDSVTSADGEGFTVTVVLPDEQGTAPGVLLLQEIFGVNDFLLAKARDLAALGYVVACPDVFWRVRPHVSLAHDDAALQEALEVTARYGALRDDVRLTDLGAALAHLRSLHETGERVAAMGYCLGGMLAYRVAAHFGPDACVSYYGSGIAELLAAGERPSCPVLLHFGGSDPYIPSEQIDAIRGGLADRDDVEVHVQPGAGHAFENLLAEQFSDPAAASRSWPLTTAFLERHLKG